MRKITEVNGHEVDKSGLLRLFTNVGVSRTNVKDKNAPVWEDTGVELNFIEMAMLSLAADIYKKRIAEERYEQYLNQSPDEPAAILNITEVTNAVEDAEGKRVYTNAGTVHIYPEKSSITDEHGRELNGREVLALSRALDTYKLSHEGI